MARACDRAGFFYVAVCDHVCIPAGACSCHVDGVVRPRGHARLARRRHPLGASPVLRLRRRLSPSAADREGVRDARRTLGRPGDPRGRRRPPRGRVHRPRNRLRPPRSAARRRHRRSSPRRSATSTRSTTVPCGTCTTSASARGRCSDRARRSGSGGNTPAALRRAAARGDGWLPQGTVRDQLPAQIAAIREHRRRIAWRRAHRDRREQRMALPGQARLRPRTELPIRLGRRHRRLAPGAHAHRRHPLRRPLPDRAHATS